MSDSESNIGLDRLLRQALYGNRTGDLEAFLLAKAQISHDIADTYSTRIARAVSCDSSQATTLNDMLREWVEIVDPQREPLAIVAARSSGDVALACPDRWEDALDILYEAAKHPSQNVHKAVEVALKRMVDAEPSRTMESMSRWTAANDLVMADIIASVLKQGPATV
jgi:hypothetical protein